MNKLSLILFGIGVGMLISLFEIFLWLPDAKKDYQLNVKLDSVYVYDGGRLVGAYKYGQNPVLDSIIINDNK